jgi:3-hydroxyisobutyrate dehydrogenase
MGMPMCAALIAAGHEVIASDKDLGRKAAALACGAAWKDTAAQAASAAEVLITMLPGPDEVQLAMAGAGGALEAMAPGASAGKPACWPGTGRCWRVWPTRT